MTLPLEERFAENVIRRQKTMDTQNKTQREIKFRQRIKGLKGSENRKGYWHYWGYLEGISEGYFQSPLGKVEWDKRPSYQYTGLKDKNNKEIYEGDIVTFQAGYYKAKRNQTLKDKVVFFGGAFQTERYCMPLTALNISEVIGNIYENENLLKEVNNGSIQKK